MNSTLKTAIRVVYWILAAVVTIVSLAMTYDIYLKHRHSWVYYVNGNFHWQECSCGMTTESHFTAIEITKEATCAEEGVETHCCDRCDFKVEKKLPKKTEHEYESAITKTATCTEEGVETYTCKCCNASYEETLEKIAHEYEVLVVKNATCAQEGIETYTCKNCNASYEETLGKIDHNFVNGICKACKTPQTEGLEYKLNSDGTYSVTGIGSCTDSEIYIPYEYNGKAVTAMGESAFKIVFP